MATAIVIVDDGQCQWGAERGRLIAALESLGWSRDGARWIEPVQPDEDEGGGANAALCAAVPLAEGYEPGDDFDADELGFDTFDFRPDLGEATWLWTRR